MAFIRNIYNKIVSYLKPVKVKETSKYKKLLEDYAYQKLKENTRIKNYIKQVEDWQL